ncbi:MAG TPA: BON domain-containing protein [Pyrinomonadaceae bacterium]|nr:BON domain-containing protein [Pyrinomonadaceae bacterium]
MKKLAALVALAALAAGCSTTDNGNTPAANSNTGVVVNNNGNANANTVANLNANANANSTRGNYNANISEADYEREKDRYGREAKGAGETIGTGLKDGYLWVKTKGALAAVDDLRDSTINVDVDNGVITLRGNVASAAQKAAAVKTANGIDGKKSVKDQLQIKADGSGANANANKAAAGGAHGNANH